MNFTEETVTIFGGSGFLGRYVVSKVAKLGCKINVLTRKPEKALFLKTCGSVGQINLIKGSINDKELIQNLVSQSDHIVNLIGILYERKKGDFVKYHSKFPEFLAQNAKKFKVKSFIHVSALGINNTASLYSTTKLEGENAIIYNFPDAAILRPSVVFGAEDNFFNKFANMASFSPFYPLIGGGKTKFQPVFVDDIAKAIVKILQKSELNRTTYELGGPNIYSFKEILDLIQKVTGRKRLYLNLPFKLASVLAAILEKLPNPQLTRDQVQLLKTNAITESRTKTFYDLNIQPKSVEEIIANYLVRFKDHSYHEASKDEENT